MIFNENENIAYVNDFNDEMAKQDRSNNHEEEYALLDGCMITDLHDNPIKKGELIYYYDGEFMTENQRWNYIYDLLEQPEIEISEVINSRKLKKFFLYLSKHFDEEQDPNDLLDFENIDYDNELEN